MTEPKVVHEWGSDPHFAVVRKPLEDLMPEELQGSRYIMRQCDALRVVDACDQWLDCGVVDRAVSKELARLAARVEELERLLGGYRSEMVDCEIENNKLREALEWIRAECEPDSIEVSSLKWLYDAANEALQEPTDD